MNAQALLKYFQWPDQSSKPVKKEFPPEAYDYEGPIEKSTVAAIQADADKVLTTQEWTVIERLGDGPKR